MRILTHDQLHRTAPAVFASQPDEAVSDRYGFVPTIHWALLNGIGSDEVVLGFSNF